MCQMPGWLPDKLDFSDFGSWESFLDHLYKLFRKDFLSKPYPRYKGQKVESDCRILDKTNKEEGFWHLLDREEEDQGERLPDLRRAEKLPWARAMLNNPGVQEMKVWNNREIIRGRESIKVYLWLEQYDYVLILLKLPYTYKVMTGYHIERKHYRRKLQKKYERRI